MNPVEYCLIQTRVNINKLKNKRVPTITILGSGTSTGVPQIGCDCNVCTSSDKRDKRLRASVLVSACGRNILIDCGPDFRQQMLDAGAPRLDALLLTHIHYDHVGGIDDLRPYCHRGPFPVYCRPDVERDIRTRLPYCFARHPYLGVPTFDMHCIEPSVPFAIPGEDGEDITVIPLPVMHAALPITGFRIGDMAYVTDCKTMPESTKALMRNLDLLVINALRHEPHPSHLSLDEALELIAELKPRRAVLTHLSHQMGKHAQVSEVLPPEVSIAYDGQVIEFL